MSVDLREWLASQREDAEQRSVTPNSAEWVKQQARIAQIDATLEFLDATAPADPLSVACGHVERGGSCGARAGDPCHTRSSIRAVPHEIRTRAAARVKAANEASNV